MKVFEISQEYSRPIVLSLGFFDCIHVGGQQIGGRLARSRLCHTQEVVAVEDLGDTALLYRGHLVEAHVIERIEYIII